MEKNNDLLIKYVSVDILQTEVVVLRDVNLEVGKGEFIYLIGRVGSGKSTLLKSFYSEVPIAGGEKAEIFDYDLQRLKRSQVPYLRRRLGIIYQDFQLLIDRTVHDNLSFVLRATGWKRKDDIEDRIIEVLKRVGMENKGYKMPHQLSGGEQQRIVIARALLNSPDIILADEPTGNLDRETGIDILELLRSIQEQGTTIIMSTHNMEWLKLYPGRVLNFGEEHMWEGEKPDFHKIEIEKKEQEKKLEKEQQILEEDKKTKDDNDVHEEEEVANDANEEIHEEVVKVDNSKELKSGDVVLKDDEKPKVVVRRKRTKTSNTKTTKESKKKSEISDSEEKPKVKRSTRKPRVKKSDSEEKSENIKK